MPQPVLIAIVDDDASMRDTTKDLLESAGYLAATFVSAESFLRSRQRKRVACLIADMRMGQMTGLELHQHLVASNQAIATILMTAHPDERVRALACKAKVICYLIKPFAAEELLACVHSALRGRDPSSN